MPHTSTKGSLPGEPLNVHRPLRQDVIESMSRQYAAGKSSVSVRSRRTTMSKVSYRKGDSELKPHRRCDLCKAYGLPLATVEVPRIGPEWRCPQCLHM